MSELTRPCLQLSLQATGGMERWVTSVLKGRGLLQHASPSPQPQVGGTWRCVPWMVWPRETSLGDHMPCVELHSLSVISLEAWREYN